ncbi:MAG: division/cell wall cluster transcriptional repressor MraZ [Bacteroidia bacterium]|nr:division/cell wall cluster transcriptional repressor MraZ [Bacteroidia bacterium]
MGLLYGEYTCRVDDKGRFQMPTALYQQLADDHRSAFVVARGLDPCLVLYPAPIWEAELQRIYTRSQYHEANRTFARLFQSGAAPVALDGQQRINLPKALQQEAGIVKELVLIGALDRIECWAAERYRSWLDESLRRLPALAEAVMQPEGPAA